MAVVSLLPRAEFGPNDHREDAPHFSEAADISRYLPPTETTGKLGKLGKRDTKLASFAEYRNSKKQWFRPKTVF